MKPALLRGALVTALLFAAIPLFAATRYDPRLRFRTIRTPHFTILFHGGEERLAARLAPIAEEVHQRLSDRLGVSTNRHTYVILVDQHDDANGWATPLPFNTIEISAAAPAPSAMVGFTDDWLRLVFTHEYVHVLHLDQSAGLFAGLRRVFGRAPVLFPNLFLPGWTIEGLATYYETEQTDLGRLLAGEFRLVVDAPARAGTFDPLDRATGALVDWPGGNAAYAYGARFHEYLARRFGQDRFARLASATAGRVPYLPGGAFTRVFGQSASQLWREFARESSEARAQTGGPERRPDDAGRPGRLTTQGFVASGPRWLPDGRIIYTSRTPHGFPSLVIVSRDRVSRTFVTRYLGDRVSVSGEVVYFDQQELVRNVGLQGDLYMARLTDARVERLTRGARAGDPDVSPDGRALVHTVQDAGRTYLVVRRLERAGDRTHAGEPRVLRDEPDTQYGAPRWSPDGRRVAAERRLLHGRPEVVVIDVETGGVEATITAVEGRAGEPEWLADGSRLVVSWERPTSPFGLYVVDLSGDRDARVLLDPPNGARSAAVTADGRGLAFVGYTVDGYDIFTTRIDPEAGATARGLKVEVGADRTRSSASCESGDAGRSTDRTGSSRPYSPVRSLLPRFWMPVVETDEDRVEAGAGTAGLDVLGRHSYVSTVRWADRARPDWDVAYAYDRWRPTLFVSASDDLTVWQDADYRETSVDAGMLLPFRTVRRRQRLYGALHATREEDPDGTFARRSVRLAYEFSTSRRYGYSVSSQDGILAGVTADITRRGLGADADGVTITADARAYPTAGGRHRVLALRGAFAGSFGDRTGRRVLGAGGAATPGSPISFGRDAIGLARGFDTDAIVGYRAAVVNIDYRLPLWIVERGLGTLPVFVRQVHAAAFLDAAHAWTRAFRLDEVRGSAGLELSSDIVLGHYLPLTVAGGVAFRRDPSGVHEGAAAFWRIGYAF